MTQSTTGKPRDFSDFQTFKDNAEQTTQNTNWVDAISKQTKRLVDGNYKIDTYCEICMQASGDKVKTRVLVDDNERGFRGPYNGTKYIPVPGLMFRNCNEGQRPTIKIQYAVQGAGGGTAKIQRCRIAIVRVGDQQ